MKAWWVLLIVALSAVPVEAQNRLQSATTAPAPTTNTTRTSEPLNVLVFVTDEQVYGFSQPSPELKRLGSSFHVYIEPHNQSIAYRILVDQVPQRLGNNQTQRHTAAPIMEALAVPGVRRASLHVEVQRGNRTTTLDYGDIRFRAPSDLAGDVRDNAIQDVLQQQLRIFTDSQFTWWTIRWGLVGVAAVVLGLFGGFQQGRAREEHEEVKTLGF